METTQKQAEEIKQMKLFASQTRTGLEQTRDQLMSFKQEFSSFRIETNNKIESNKDDLQEQILSSDKFVSEMAQSMQTEIAGIRKLATEQMKQQERELVDRFSGQFGEVKTYMETHIAEISKATEQAREKLNAAIKKIKGVCSDYFLQYEGDLEEMRIRTHVLENKYADWSKVLIEPASINDARLFAAEARLQEEEDMRIKEYTFLRDLMRKLIYSFEQTSIDRLEHGPKLGDESLTLPQLPPASPARTREREPEHLEAVTLKRLNFLRQSLEAHDPKETTARLRQHANQKRDERMLELWRRD